MCMLRRLLPAIVVGLLLTACGKNEPPAKARANAPLQLPKAALDDGAGKADPNEGLKERLARQEAASKLFDKAKPEPPPPPKAEPKAESAKSAAAAKAEPVKAEPAKPAEAPPPVAEKKAEPAPPPAAAPAPAPRTDVAAAKPAAPAPAPSAGIPGAKLVSKVDPDFPREAVQQGINKGLVKVRMTLDGNGNVMKVDIVEAQPRRIFDRSVVRALSQWRFNDGPSGRIVETEVEFGSR